MMTKEKVFKPNSFYRIGVVKKDWNPTDTLLHWAKNPITMSGSDLKIRGIRKISDIYNLNPFGFNEKQTVCIFVFDPETKNEEFVHAGMINTNYRPESLSDHNDIYPMNNGSIPYQQQNNDNDTIEYIKSFSIQLQQEIEELRERNKELTEELLEKRNELAQLHLRKSIQEEIEEKLAKEISAQNKSTGLDGILESATALAPIANLLMGLFGNNKQQSLPTQSVHQSSVPKPVFNNIEEEL